MLAIRPAILAMLLLLFLLSPIMAQGLLPGVGIVLHGQGLPMLMDGKISEPTDAPPGGLKILLPIGNIQCEWELDWMHVTINRDSATGLRASLAVLPAARYKQVRIFFPGVRAGIVYMSYEEGRYHSESAVDYYLGPVIAAEYLLSSHFAVVGEYFAYYKTLNDVMDDYYEGSAIGTTNRVSLAWYF